MRKEEDIAIIKEVTAPEQGYQSLGNFIWKLHRQGFSPHQIHEQILSDHNGHYISELAKVRAYYASLGYTFEEDGDGQLITVLLDFLKNN